jgi:hypothetical protein
VKPDWVFERLEAVTSLCYCKGILVPWLDEYAKGRTSATLLNLYDRLWAEYRNDKSKTLYLRPKGDTKNEPFQYPSFINPRKENKGEIINFDLDEEEDSRKWNPFGELAYEDTEGLFY